MTNSIVNINDNGDLVDLKVTTTKIICGRDNIFNSMRCGFSQRIKTI